MEHINTKAGVKDRAGGRRGGWARHNKWSPRPFAGVFFFVSLLTMLAGQAFAGSDRCAGGGFTVLGLSGKQKRTVLARNVGSSFLVKGKYVEFTVDAATFGVRNWTLTGA